MADAFRLCDKAAVLWRAVKGRSVLTHRQDITVVHNLYKVQCIGLCWGLGKVLTTPPWKNFVKKHSHAGCLFWRQNNPEVNYSPLGSPGGGSVSRGNIAQRVHWIGLAQDRDRWLTLVSAVMNFRVP